MAVFLTWRVFSWTKIAVLWTTHSVASQNVYNSMNSATSGGEKQKFAIIRMFLSSADVWLLDESTSALDLVSTKHFYEELKRQKERYIIIMISHEIPQEYDEVIEMRQEI